VFQSGEVPENRCTRSKSFLEEVGILNENVLPAVASWDCSFYLVSRYVCCRIAVTIFRR
jgi:hypothetical protein